MRRREFEDHFCILSRKEKHMYGITVFICLQFFLGGKSFILVLRLVFFQILCWVGHAPMLLSLANQWHLQEGQK